MLMEKEIQDLKARINIYLSDSDVVARCFADLTIEYSGRGNMYEGNIEKFPKENALRKAIASLSPSHVEKLHNDFIVSLNSDILDNLKLHLICKKYLNNEATSRMHSSLTGSITLNQDMLSSMSPDEQFNFAKNMIASGMEEYDRFVGKIADLFFVP